MAYLQRENGRQVLGLKPHVTEMARLYPGLTQPVELLHGTSDTTVLADIHARPLSRLLPQARLTLLPGTGHMPHHARPDAVLESIGRLA